MNTILKRVLSLLLCFVLVAGYLPVGTLAAEIGETGASSKGATEEILDAAIFCSDVHGHPSTVTSIFNGIKSADSTFKPTTAAFVGDTQTTASSVTSAAQAVYSNVQCIYAFGNHDDEGDYGIDDFTGLSYGDSTTNYYIYTISENAMSISNPDTSGFTSTVAGLDKTKPLFIISHLPLHARRGDSNGAAAWYTAISAAAEQMDIAFFWAHNHTNENAVDQAAYYVAKDGSETITLENTNTVVTPNFTYLNAGYISPPNTPARNNVATAVRIYADSINYTVYNASGELSGTYAVNETVAREFASSTPTLSSIEVTGTTNYVYGEELDLTVTAYYSDGNSADVTADATLTGYSKTVVGKQTVTASYEGQTDTIDVTVGDISKIDITTEPTKLTYDVGEELDTTGMVVTVYYTNDLTREITSGWYTSNVDMSTIGEKTVTVNYAVNNITYSDTYTITVEEQIAENATLTGLEITSDPVKTEYLLSQALDITGMVVEATFSDGLTKTLSYGGFVSDVAAAADYYYNIENFNMYVAKGQEVVVTFTYGDVTLTDTFKINVWAEDFTDETTGVKVHVTGDYGIAGATVAESTNANVAAAIAGVISGEKYKAYDISLTFDEGYSTTETTKTVTLPIPEGVNNPVVYYVSDDGETVTNMNAVKDGNGNVTFTTTHFSTYVIGESTEIEVPENETVPGSGTTTTTEKKTIYKLVSSLTAGEEYLIISRNSAGSGYGLAASTTGVSVTVKAADDVSSVVYIEDKGDALEWTASSGWAFSSGNYDLGVTSGSSRSLTFSTSSDWTLGTNQLYYKGSSNSYYLACSDGTWSVSRNNTSSRYAYFYQKTEVEVKTSTTVSGTYSIEGEDLTVAVSKGSIANLTSTLTFTPDDGTATTTDVVSTTATYEIDIVDVNGNTVNGDPNDIISEIKNGVVTFTGNYGTALVKVSYTTSFGDVTDYITIEATAPYYTIELCDPVTDDEGNTTYEPITKPVALKGVEEGYTYSVWAVVKEHNSANPDGVDQGELGNRLTWSVSDESIATIDPDTGVITFTGTNYGTFTVTVAYKGDDGKVITDTITISATESLYVVPGDGTDDFPEYPNQGAVRFDKTATAVGNFSETGIAKVELSMTGVPYGTSAKTDVVIMVDMTASMSNDDVTAAELAVQELIENLVYDEENDKYDSNIQIFVDVFYSASSDSSFETEEYLNCVTISSADELTDAKNLIDFTQSSSGGGTRYNMAMADVYETLNREGHADNQFVVFVSDGVATAYSPLTDGEQGTTITGNNSETNSLAAGWFDDEGEVTDEFETEYYSYLIKTAGIPIYTVGCNLTALSDAADVLNHMSSNYSPDGKTSTGETKYSFFCTTSGGITDEVLAIFAGIGQDIKEAAIDVVVEDKIGSDYSVNFTLPSGVTSTEAGMEEFYIQIVEYTLDETTHERTTTYTVLEKFTFNADGTITHEIGTTTCGDTCAHVTYTNGEITKIDGTYFDYEKTDDGEFMYWYADKLTTAELAMQYFVYLDNSAGDIAAADQVEAGTYYTNDYATLTYTNYLGHQVQQEFPIPQMTWNGAQVTYVFYLVNEKGQPVNRAGRVIPFAEAVYVTDPVTFDVHWNEETGSENILAEDIFATAGVPEVYNLYDESAAYVIRVYQTENVDENGVNGNYFQITGAVDKLIDSEMDTDTTVDNSTTKVFNTKAGQKYDVYGIYSIYNVGTTLTNGTNNITTTVKAADIDYANTTVAFAVVWKPELVEDAVVIDYGLDVVIDVITNDNMAAGVVGVRTDKPDAEINSGRYSAAGAQSVDVSIGSNQIEIGTASVENLNQVRFSLDETNGMLFTNPAVFYYEADVNYYIDTELQTTSMYSQVTVIPATSIYYEDDFLTLASFSKQDDGTWAEDENSAWTTEGTKKNATQDQDRPGESKISAALDADNNYGYDSAYETMATHSQGSGAKVHVNADSYATATFSFYGTGFDVISMTSNTTGTITVLVKEVGDADGDGKEGETVRNTVVDTYYGMEEDGTLSANNPSAIYQVPVIKIFDLPYGQYTVKITVAYNSIFDHANADGYDLYLDAIRIYDPTGNRDETANNAYKEDREAFPIYEELRDKIIAASEYKVTENEDGTVTVTGNDLDGPIFIDCNDEVTSIADYVSYGPNNELYLANGQAIAFTVVVTETMADVQLGIKVANGGSVTYEINGDSYTVNTTTDMYYSIWEYVKDGKVVTIKNVSGGILSLTNIKTTFDAETSTNGLLRMTAEDAGNALLMLRRAPAVEEEVPETTVPEETEPEETVPETTEPDETEPEVTDPETEPTEPEVKDPDEDSFEKVTVEKLVEAVKKIVNKLFGWLFG